jgi:hypothetical protein
MQQVDHRIVTLAYPDIHNISVIQLSTVKGLATRRGVKGGAIENDNRAPIAGELLQHARFKLC